MLTLSYGFKKPEDGDTGQTLFDALEENIQQLNDHLHDGIDTPKLNSTALVAVEQTVTAAGWLASGATGHYRQSVTLPAGFEFDTIQIGFRKSTGEVILPTVEKIDATQYYVYSTDNTLILAVVYGG